MKPRRGTLFRSILGLVVLVAAPTCILPSYRSETGEAAAALECSKVYCDPANQGAECDDQNPCTNDVCDASTNSCSCVPLPDDTPTPDVVPIAGDCALEVCKNGKSQAAALEKDLPFDEPCLDEYCAGTKAVLEPSQAGQPCGEGENTKCDGKGACVGCISDGECPAVVCQAPKCDGGSCSTVPTGAGLPIPDDQQNAQDCQILVCDDQGAVVSTKDPADVPLDDGNECTAETCEGGSPQHKPKYGEKCAGGRCNAQGVCVQCLEPGDCPDPGSCKTRTCEGNVCGTAPKPKETPCAGGNGKCDGDGSCLNCLEDSDCGNDTECIDFECVAGACKVEVYVGKELPAPFQKDGDCKVLVCDQAGAPEVEADDGDLPPGDGNECTAEGCSGGSPTTEVLTGDPCGGGQKLCNQSGACVDCLGGGDCDPKVCHDVACQSGGCSYTKVAVGAACAGGKCDGAGQCVECLAAPECAVKECQDASCTGGKCTWVPSPKGTPCGNKTCDGQGSCKLGAPGAPCSNGAECGSGYCVGNACCDKASCPTCKSCKTGTCKPDDDLSCTGCGAGADAGADAGLACVCKDGSCVPD